MNTDELAWRGRHALNLKAQSNSFLSTRYELIEGTGLRVATLQGRNRRYVIAVCVHFYNDVELFVHTQILHHLARGP